MLSRRLSDRGMGELIARRVNGSLMVCPMPVTGVYTRLGVLGICKGLYLGWVHAGYLAGGENPTGGVWRNEHVRAGGGDERPSVDWRRGHLEAFNGVDDRAYTDRNPGPIRFGRPGPVCGVENCEFKGAAPRPLIASCGAMSTRQLAASAGNGLRPPR